MEKRTTFSNVWLAGALIAPQLLLIFLFFYWPASQALYWAFTTQPPFGGANQWVGLDNFRQIFTDRIYWHSVFVSVEFAALSTSLSIGIAIVLALFVDRGLAGSRFYRFVYFWPFAIAAPAVGLAFRFIFAPDAGLVSVINRWIPDVWNPALHGLDAMILIVIANAWKMAAFNFIFLLAGLQQIPRSLGEAAALDGASVLRRFRDIQLPLVAPTVFFLLVINITESFVDAFGIVDVTTGGGPARATELMVFKIYSDGFKSLDYSMASAQSVVLMLLVVALTMVQFRYLERRIHYR